ncbi:MAG: sulfide/dihydroorotate dehydrogenase-like FAD/NAD-binding protein [Clostridia bacterium]
MYKILDKQILNNEVEKMTVFAPHIAEKGKPGQFIILRVSENGERIPFTIANTDIKTGGVTIIYQIVGGTTLMLSKLKTGDDILDFVGPLGTPSKLDGYKKVAVVGGGLGCAIAYPQAKALFNMGTKVDIIAGFRNKEIIILEEEMKKVSDNLIICTDDGSNGNKGLVTDMLKKQIEQGSNYDAVIVVGPLIMMKFVALLTKEYNIHTVCSMNPIMIDGTGMCGGCRLTVGGETKFACVDGPEFDAHLVDFDEAIRRSSIYKPLERKAHECALFSKKEE